MNQGKPTTAKDSRPRRGAWSRLLDGRTTPPSDPLMLRAGPLSLQFEDGGLRYIHLGDRELVRRLYSAVRDINWGTISDRLSNLRTSIYDDSFSIEFDVRNVQAEIDFAWHGSITGEPSGRIIFAMSGVANTTFRKNRIGFCILHPMELAGSPVEIRRANGSTEQTHFPRYIAPQNPFLDIVGLRHPAAPGIEVTQTFEGDIFETEDQRNWIDASFKTFCTPLSRPFPVTVNAGEKISQRVIIELINPAGKEASSCIPAPSAGATSQITLDIGKEPVGPLPRMGFAIPASTPPLSPLQIERLQCLRPSYLRCELSLPADYASRLWSAAQIADQLSADLEIVVLLGEGAERELDHLHSLVKQLGPNIARWTLFPQSGWSTTRELVEMFRGRLPSHGAAAPIGGGTLASFCELNRRRPPTDVLDFIAWSMQPQEHAFDNASLAETLAAQAAAVASARQFTGDLPLVVGPITLKRRVNPYSTGPWPPDPLPGELPFQVDVRQTTLFGAGWTLGSIKYLAVSGVHAVTYYELIGWKGLNERETGSPLPDLFPSLPGCVFPLYHVLADLAERRDALVLPVRSSDPLQVEALALTSEIDQLAPSPTRLLVANLTAKPKIVTLPTAARTANVRFLAEHNVREAMLSPETFRQSGWTQRPIRDHRCEIDLTPYALACVDLQ
jgi:D-apionolactonase